MAGTVFWALAQQWRYARASFICLFALIPIALGMKLIGIYLPKTVVADVLAQSGYSTALLHAALMIGGLCLLGTASDGIDTMKTSLFGGCQWTMWQKLSLKSMRVDYETTENPEFAGLYSRAQRSLWSSGPHSPFSRLSETAVSLLRDVLGYLLFGAVVSTVSPWIALALTAAPALNLLLQRRSDAYEYANRGNWAPLDRKLSYIVGRSRTFETAKDIRIYGLGGWFSEMYGALMSERLRWSRRVALREFGVRLGDLAMILLRDGLAYCILISMALRGELTADRFVLCFAAIGGFADWVGGIVNDWSAMRRLYLKVCDLREVLDWPEPAPGTEPDAEVEEPCVIDLQGVCYRYAGADEDALKNVCLHITKGEKLAVVGLNGAGKTTLVKLISGLYRPSAGSVTVSGRTVDELGRRRWYGLFAALFQNMSVLNVTLGEIVSSEARGNYDREKALRCCEIAGLADKLASLPLGLDTPMNKQLYADGTELSGGERQKLALAKAIYKPAPVLLLDEPTAALDPIAENEMYLRYAELTRGRTSVFISHRLSSTRFCDRIVFLEHGRVAEEGTHEELMRLHGKYAELFETQSRYYKV